MKRIAIAVLAAAGFAGVSVASAEEVAQPAKAATCFACHGERGAKPTAPMYPVLAGQYANYIEHALTEYKEGKRKNPIMGAQAGALSAEEIHELARYFADQPSPLFKPSVHGDAHAAQ